MPGKFERRKFKDCSLNDVFFASLKNDYPEFEEWFAKKAKSEAEAFVFEDTAGISAFIYIKEDDCEEIKLKNSILPKMNRIKIGTLKLADRQQGQRLGEGAIGIALWRWQEIDVDEIYLTVYDTHTDLISLIERYGFVCKGELYKSQYIENKKELVYVKSKRHLNYITPQVAFPYLNPNFSGAGMLPIFDYFHDRLLPYSELKNTQQEFWDEAAGNGITKVFIGSPTNVEGLHTGDPIFLYRIYTGQDKGKTYKSCITSFGTITNIFIVKSGRIPHISFEEFKRKCGNKTIFSIKELENEYKKDNLVIFEFVYNGFFGKGNNISHYMLKQRGLFNDYPYKIRYTKEEFFKIIELGGKNVQNIIIN